MLNFAPVCPIQIAKALHEKGALGEYHLLLAHDILKNASEYQNLYGKGDMGTVILDNSASELGEGVSRADMLSAALIVRPNVFVLPDVIMDAERTIVESITALKHYRQSSYMEDVEYMAVPQGKDLLDYFYCLRSLINQDGVDWIGIPRNVRKKLHYKRFDVVKMIQQSFPEKKIHLLGMSGDLYDEHVCAELGIQGMDSSAPVYMGMRDSEHIMSITTNTDRGKWWDTQTWTEEDIDHAVTNILYIRDGENY